MRIDAAALVRLGGRLRGASLNAGAVGIDVAAFLRLARSRRATLDAGAVGINSAAFLFPETGEEVPELDADLEDPRDEAVPAVGSRAGLVASGGRRREDYREDDHEDGALRKAETRHTVSPFRAAPGRAGVGRAGASLKNRCPKANKFILESSGMRRQGV